jgi:hypothetical protein
MSHKYKTEWFHVPDVSQAISSLLYAVSKFNDGIPQQLLLASFWEIKDKCICVHAMTTNRD